jgi:hypothetical protein
MDARPEACVTWAELRCTGRHPQFDRPCDALLGHVVPGTVEIDPANGPTPGCVTLRCWRCGAKYQVCPVRRSA